MSENKFQCPLVGEVSLNVETVEHTDGKEIILFKSCSGTAEKNCAITAGVGKSKCPGLAPKE